MATQFYPGSRVCRGSQRGEVLQVSRGCDLILVLRSDLHAAAWDTAANWEPEEVPVVGSREWLQHRAEVATYRSE